ncbi:MAG: dethiobiotin synthase [Planctomycetaceae bacterium]
MEPSKPRILFFAGTDTDVGKTFVASLAVTELRHSGLRVGVYKPVASGCSRQDGELVSADAVRLWEASGRAAPLQLVCPQRFVAPLAPHLAASLEGKAVDEDALLAGIEPLSSGVDVIVVEGAGGLMSPLSENLLNSDLARKLRAQVVIVAANRLGAIHQLLATVTAAASLRLPVVGAVLNQVTAEADDAVGFNAATIRRFTDVPLLGAVDFGATASGIDWNSLPPPRNPAIPIAPAWL